MLVSRNGGTHWNFYGDDDQPLFLEDTQRPGSLLQLTYDAAAECYRCAPCDLTFDDLTPTDERLAGWEEYERTR